MPQQQVLIVDATCLPHMKAFRAELDEIVERYRAQLRDDRSKGTFTREEALKRILKLGFTASDAGRWLGPKPSRPEKSAMLRR